MARLSARGELDLGEGSRYAGSFRAHGTAGARCGTSTASGTPASGPAAAEALGERLQDALAVSTASR